MTKATTQAPARPLHLKPEGSRPGVPGRSSALNAAFALFTMTLVRQAKSRKLLVLAALYLLPIGFAMLMREYGSGWRGPHGEYTPGFAEFTLILNLLPVAIVPLTALVYASGMIQDEIEEQTITYLLIRPLPRWSIYLAKLLATMVVTIGLAVTFTAVTYLVVGWGHPDYWGEGGGRSRMFKTIALFALTLTAYNSLFGLLSLMMRRAILVGIGYIILLENVVANIDFVIRKVTIMYYFRVMCERWMGVSEMSGDPFIKMNYNIDFDVAPTFNSCLATLSIASAVLVALSCYLMNSREFRVKTPEGS